MGNKQYRLTDGERELIDTVRMFRLAPEKLAAEMKSAVKPVKVDMDWKKVFDGVK